MTPLLRYRQQPPHPGVSRRGDRILAGIGFSEAHISPLPSKVSAWVGAGMVRITPERYEIGRVGGGRRGAISGFSKWSRRRLLRLLGMVRKDAPLPLFITLTYPATFPSAAQSKRDLDAFLKRLARAYPAASAIWRLEAQKRGAPHYHLLVWGTGFVPHQWVAQSWYDVVGSGDEKHLAAGTRVERVRSWRGVWSYTSKYIAKASIPPDSELWKNPGRFWGIHNRAALPIVEPTVVTISQRTYWRLQLRMLKERGKVFEAGHCWTITHFCDDPHIWVARALRLDPDPHIQDWKS